MEWNESESCGRRGGGELLIQARERATDSASGGKVGGVTMISKRETRAGVPQRPSSSIQRLVTSVEAGFLRARQLARRPLRYKCLEKP